LRAFEKLGESVKELVSASDEQLAMMIREE